MKQATKRTKAKQASVLSTIHLQKRLREGGCIVLGMIAVFLMMALFTYMREDPGWSHTGQDTLINNAAGRTGAWFADILFSLFGQVAYLIPCAVLYAGARLFREAAGEEEVETALALWMVRLIGIFVTLITSCGLIAMHSVESNLPMGSGGVLGDLLKQWVVPQLNWAGSTVTLLGAALVGVTLFTGFSWIKASEIVGKLGFALLKVLQKCFLGWLDQRIQKHRDAIARASASIPSEGEQPLEPMEEEWEMLLKQEPKPKKKIVTLIPKIERKAVPKETIKTQILVAKGFPSLELLEGESGEVRGYNETELEMLSRMVETRLQEFGVEASVVGVLPGPVVTRFELDLAAGIKVSKVTGLAKDLARALSVVSVRVVEVIPGKSYVGLEIPNADRAIVRLKNILESDAYLKAESPLTIALGKDIAGNSVAVDLGKMPHLLVAGTTGSGKSVGLNAMLLSILYKARPQEVRLILIDPKMLELAIYEGVPHLLTPVVTDMKEAANALRWCVAEMERRYQLMAQVGVRNVGGFNRKVSEATAAGEPLFDPFTPEGVSPVPLEPLPYIVVVIDEFADMMMVVGKKVEELIARIAQKARAAGIHLILATQRPSVDVITGLIKANIPTRISFQVSSRIDSRTILDQQGAEQLLGHGDMLYLAPGTGVPVRVHGAFVADEEVHQVVASWRSLGSPNYIEDILQGSGVSLNGGSGFMEDEQDPLYDEAVAIVTGSRNASISQVQRRLKIGYNRAARLLEMMEQAGVVSSMQTNGAREVLAPPPVEV